MTVLYPKSGRNNPPPSSKVIHTQFLQNRVFKNRAGITHSLLPELFIPGFSHPVFSLLSIPGFSLFSLYPVFSLLSIPGFFLFSLIPSFSLKPDFSLNTQFCCLKIFDIKILCDMTGIRTRASPVTVQHHNH